VRLEASISTIPPADVDIDVGQEIIDALVATGKHEIKILTRSVSSLILHHTFATHLTPKTRSRQPSLLLRT
jgi:hypothetical protein